MIKIILGIDPGIADTGYGVIKVESGKLTCLTYGSIKTRVGTPLIARLEILHRELDKIIKKYRPELVAIEQLFFNKNVRTALIVGQARGVVLLTVSQNKLPLIDCTPSQVKQAVTAYGQANKKQVQKMVKIILGLKELPEPDDAADALAVAVCASNLRLCPKN
ncbi:TPA: crossover junction endodeoxyribonuclease RuvC [Candidatus Falkowbacteria bacterium]|jgi:crossover junction endodeoxyribonuclease RuvC|nr:MAG: Crossover junction endodeoxyribonuclease RuvC [Candidatus Falkowbacteria bacterium GW2011_GWF2_43_32]HBA36793.1 crossover junction endodeoxyribonuclease RuvC [Candidatus Falkowbacteria bacterium]